MPSRLIVALALLTVPVSRAWSPECCHQPLTLRAVSRSSPPCLLAKKKSKPRKKKAPSIRAQPFSQAGPAQEAGWQGGTPQDSMANVDGASFPAKTGTATKPRAAEPLNDRLDQVLRNAGITPTDGGKEERMRVAPDPLSKIPKAGQELLERFFGGGAIVFGTAFILSGIAVAVEAVCKVTGNPLPTVIDEALVQYVEPAMTPSILILFFFSISLGLLKQLQMSSEQGGVLYTEEDE